MSRQLYEEKILEHYQEPHNEGTIDDADMDAHVENPHCGDAFTFTAALDDGIISDIRFEGEGCALSIASASMLTERVEERPVEDAIDVGQEDILDMMGIQKDAVAPVRMKCILLARDGIEAMVNKDA
ncbi:MAG: SUF system NifU family Fe-S cluster assembly protein [Candidatus Nanohaloarchaea archaeon]|nr:SUF system NifU family Fe-S cluster assembly protein [Candidatus Nanohaloarchaea archaeon]